MAIALIVDAKKGMSILQVSRHFRFNCNTAWYLAHRIREAMLDADRPRLAQWEISSTIRAKRIT